VKTYGPRAIKGYGPGAVITANVRYDDECGNGHNSFSITADVVTPASKRRNDIEAGGCLHEDVARVFPELAPFIKWHLFDSSGPMHYVANTLYHASDRDHNGLKAGERRQRKNGRTGLPMWELVAVQAPGVLVSQTPTGKEYDGKETIPLFLVETRKSFAVGEAPPIPTLRWEPSWTEGEGKERKLDYARSTAVWPDATDAELIALADMPRAEAEAILLARLPALVAEFKSAVESLGFVY
jgi:hypothetical protein